MSLPAWMAPRGASVAGAAHGATPAANQDFWRHGRIQDSDDAKGYIVAVADGAGSARCALQGAEHATLAVSSAVRRSLKRMRFGDLSLADIESWAEAAHGALATLAKENGGALGDYHCTLLFVVAAPDRVLVGQVGDGAIVAAETDTWRSLTIPTQGEWANQTAFITLPEWRSYLQHAIVTQPLTRLALFTDGLQPSLLGDHLDRPHSPGMNGHIAPFFSTPPISLNAHQEMLTGWLQSEPVSARSSDDKTLVLMARAHVHQSLV